MTRPHLIHYMKLALAVADGSRCKRAKYGSLCLDTRDRVVSTGRNGKPQNSICDEVCFREGLPPNARDMPCCLHSEINCLIFANFSEIQGGTFVVSGMPCEACALAILQSGVNVLVCLEDARGYPGLETIDKYQGTGPNIDGRRVQVVVIKREEVGLT